VRLVRLSAQSARVSDDIRAALTSLGRGNTVVGGVALIGVKAPGCDQAVDAVVALPRGIVVVVAVDLPDPAVKLEAPLSGQWKADGWPLVGSGDAINPAVDALALAGSVAEALRPVVPENVNVGTVVAVGPYVETVDAPPAELTGPVRVLFPSPTNMLAATVSLASGTEPCTVDDVSAILRLLAPDTRLPSAAALAAEGFTAGEPEPVAANPLATATVTVPAEHPDRTAIAETVVMKTVKAKNPPAQTQPAKTPPSKPASAPEEPNPPVVPAQRGAGPSPQAPARRAAEDPHPAQPSSKPPTAAVTARRPPRARLIPIAVILLVLAVLAIVIVITTSSGSSNEAPEDGVPDPTAPPGPASAPIDGIVFTQRAAGADAGCAVHATGDLQSGLQTTDCDTLRRGSFETEVGGRPVAVSVAVATFAAAETATSFKEVADTPGGGTIADLATAIGQWPAGPPRFEMTAYASSATQASVRLVQACWLEGPSTPDDPLLARAAAAALRVPVAG